MDNPHELLQNIFAIVGALVTVATIIVKLTPSQKDDAILAKFIKVVDFFSVVNPKNTVPPVAKK